MPIQLKRLLILSAILISFFFVLKYLLTPDTFGQYGHYRGAALAENASLEPKYVGRDACIECHEEIVAEVQDFSHSTVECENCHGPGYKHVLDSDYELTKPDSRAFCGKCHAFNRARPESAVTQQNMNEHNPELDCIECHYPHMP